MNIIIIIPYIPYNWEHARNLKSAWGEALKSCIELILLVLKSLKSLSFFGATTI